MSSSEHARAVERPRTRLAKLGRPLLRFAMTAAVVVGIVVMVRGLAAGDLVDALARARVWPIVAASVIAIGVYALKAVSWRIMLSPRFELPLGRLVRYTIVAFAGSAIAPARAGEVIRIWLLKRREGVDVATSVAVATSEKAMDVFSLLVVAAPLPWLLALPVWLEHGFWVLACVVLAAVPIIALLSTRVRPESWCGRFLAALERRPRQLLAVFIVLTIGWIADVVAVMLVMYALDISVSWPGALLVLFVVNVVIALPSTPGQLGTHELGAMIPLVDILGVAKEQALAFALVYHATQILPTLVIGIALEWRLLFGLRPDARRDYGTCPDLQSSRNPTPSSSVTS